MWDGSSTPQVLNVSGNTSAHDPTVVEANGVFYRYWTGNNIPAARSTDLVNWQNAPSAISGGYASWVNEWLSGIPGESFGYP